MCVLFWFREDGMCGMKCVQVGQMYMCHLFSYDRTDLPWFFLHPFHHLDD